MMGRIIRENTGFMSSGQDLVVAGYIGRSGTMEIVRHKREELLQWFSKDYLDQIMHEGETVPVDFYKVYKEYGATECEPVSEGGILAAVWNLSGAYRVGIEFSLRKIPIKQNTIEICERFELNPYRLLSGNCFLLTSDNGGDLVREFNKKGISCSVIGKVTHGMKRIIDHGGSKGYLDRPTEDELYKAVPQCDLTWQRSVMESGLRNQNS